MLKNKFYKFLFSFLVIFLFSQSGAWFSSVSISYAADFQGDARIIDDTHLDFSPNQLVYPLNIISGNCASNVGNIGVTSVKFFKGDYPDDSRQFGSSVGTPTLYSNNSDLSILISKGDDFYWAQFVISTMNNANCGYSAKGDVVYVTFEVLNGKLKTINPPARANCVDGIQNQNETSVDVGGVCNIYSSLYSDASEGISSSFNKVVQTLGTNLNGILTKIDIKTSNLSAIYYGSRPWLNLYECTDETYGSTVFSGSNCTMVYSGSSDDSSKLTASIQRFYTNPIVFNPSKYYFFTSAGNNAFNTTPSYYGSSENIVDGICYQYRLGSSITITPCATVLDLYFNFYGISKVVPVLSSEKAVTSFIFQSLNPVVNGVVDEENHTITLDVPLDTDITSLAPMISISDKATVSPNSNVVQDFTNPVIYTVTAEDGSTQTYTVTVKKVCTVDCFSNVLFLPGIMGSSLYEIGLDCGSVVTGPECGDQQLWVSASDLDQAKLGLDSQGKSINNLFTKNDTENNGEEEKGIIDEVSDANIYKSFISDLKNWKQEGIITDYAFIPYDWRLSLEDIITNGATSGNNNLSYTNSQNFSESFILKKLEALQVSSKSGKVTIVAHSNGGLVVKALIQKLKDTNNSLYNKIDKIIFIAVPQVGTPDAVVTLLHGSTLGPAGLIMDNGRSRQLSENMPSVYNLLPSASYFTTVDPAFAVDKIISFEDQPFFNIQTSQYGIYVSNQTEFENYILGTDGRSKPSLNDTVHPNIGNPVLYSQAKNVHQILDSWMPSSNTKVIQVAGWGEETIAGLDYGTYKEVTETLSYKPRFVVDGDGTVVAPSALWMSNSNPNVERWWVDLKEYNKLLNLNIPREHKNIFEISNIRKFIESKIKNKTEFSDPDNIIVNNNSTLTSQDTRLHYTLHSPLSLGITDTEGRYTGMDPITKEIKQEIPGVTYRQIGEVQFLSVPAGVAYTLKLQGYTEGVFSLDAEKQTGNEITESISFEGIASSTLTLATINITSSSLISASELKIDQDGNGSVDQIYHVVDDETQATIVAPVVLESDTVSNNESLPIPVKVQHSQIPIKVIEQQKVETKEVKEIVENVIISVNPTMNDQPIQSIAPVKKKKIVKKVAVVVSKKIPDLVAQNETEIKVTSKKLSASVINSGAGTGFWGIIGKFIYNIFN